jgi:hypothetical protein
MEGYHASSGPNSFLIRKETGPGPAHSGQRGPHENPLTSLYCLKDAIKKHTTVDPESQVEKVLPKDKFLIQSAPDIHRKLQKSVAEGEKSVDQWTN